MRKVAMAACATAGLVSIVSASPAAAACQVAKIAELPVTLVGQRAMVDAKFGTHQTRFILDSGAFYSTLSRASAAEFELPTQPAPPNFRLRGINGDTSAAIARAKNLTLAGIVLPPVEFLVGGSDTGTAGLLGQNILGLADVEYDLPHGMVRLLKITGCSNVALAYWAQGKPYSVIPLERGANGPFKPHTVGTVTVNGVKMRAVFDTGATSTIMTMAAAKRAGITPASPGVVSAGMTSGIGSKQVPAWLASFDKVDLGGEIIPHPKFRMANIDLEGDILIGFDFFLTHRMFVSNANHQLYMTYEGGRLFGITPTGARSAAGEQIDLTDKSAEPKDADGFGRRAAVLMSQRKFLEALSDIDKAVAMAPKDGRYLYLRAEARLALGQSLLAASDLDKAVALMPDDAEPRLTRARLRLGHRDPDGAAEDIKAADRILPAASDHRLQLAGLYNVIDQPEAALTNYDAWLKMHGEDADRASAYNGRCWSRALLNRELARALSDCNTALRLRPGHFAFLDSRALVYLRLGNLDAAIADYDAALKVRPREAWSLYGRAIAQKRAGKTDAADADRKAALAINPDVAKRAAKLGLEG